MLWIKKGIKDKKATLLGIHTKYHKGVSLPLSRAERSEKVFCFSDIEMSFSHFPCARLNMPLRRLCSWRAPSLQSYTNISGTTMAHGGGGGGVDETGDSLRPYLFYLANRFWQDGAAKLQ